VRAEFVTKPIRVVEVNKLWVRWSCGGEALGLRLAHEDSVVVISYSTRFAIQALTKGYEVRQVIIIIILVLLAIITMLIVW
jgi:hypothetical protein